IRSSGCLPGRSVVLLPCKPAPEPRPVASGIGIGGSPPRAGSGARIEGSTHEVFERLVLARWWLPVRSSPSSPAPLWGFLQVDRMMNATASGLSGAKRLDWKAASAVPRSGQAHWWSWSDGERPIVLKPDDNSHASDKSPVIPVDERVAVFARDLTAPTFAMFVLCVMVATWASSNRCLQFFPESGTLILVATIAGVVGRYVGTYRDSLDDYSTDFAVAYALNLGLMPIIMFNCGWQVDRAHFMSEFEHILNFAVIGTILNTMLIASGSWLAGYYGLHAITSVRANLAFACLISSPLLYTMVFGEAAINDAVAITLFTLVNSSGSTSIGEEIAICLFGSILCGAALACLVVSLMGYCRMHGRSRLLTLATLGSAWLIFAMAESMDLSGIIANLFAGIVFRSSR
ncbi:unnamed protein product, partial [Prorocentrum cordatum]